MARPKKQDSETEKLERQFDEFDNQVKSLTLDRMNEAKKEEVEPQTKLSSKQLENEIFLKPKKFIADNQKFNEKFRDEWNYQKQYVRFIAENKEVIGETIELWTHPFGGVGAEYWEVPTNKPVNGPRYLAEQIKRCTYHRLYMDESRQVASDGRTTMYGQMVADKTISRLTAEPCSTGKSIFMGIAA